MRFMTYVFGDQPEAALQKRVGSEYDFIVGKELQTLCEDNGVPFDTHKLFDTIREATGASGVVAFVEPNQVKVICPKLYLAGVRHFVAMENGVPKAVNRLVMDETLMAKSPAGQLMEEVTKEMGDAFDLVEVSAKADRTDVMLAVSADHSESTAINSFNVGGGWNNWLIKKGTDGQVRANSLPLKDVDWDRMWEEHIRRLGLDVEWEKIVEILNGRTFENHHKVHERHQVPKEYTKEASEKYDAARQEFLNQPAVMALTEVGYTIPETTFIAAGKEAFLKFKALGSFLPMAYLDKDNWKQRAHREFMGLLEESIYPEEWLEELTKVMDNLPEDTLITVMECHC